MRWSRFILCKRWFYDSSMKMNEESYLDLLVTKIAKRCKHLDLSLAKFAKNCNHLKTALAKVAKVSFFFFNYDFSTKSSKLRFYHRMRWFKIKISARNHHTIILISGSTVSIDVGISCQCIYGNTAQTDLQN